MPDPELPPDLPSFLKTQRELNEAMLNLIRRVQRQSGSSLHEEGAGGSMLPLDSADEFGPEGRPDPAALASSSPRRSYRFVYFVLTVLAVLAGFLVIKPPPAPSMEEQRLHQELIAQKSAYEARVSNLTAALKGNQEALIGTQEALGDVQKELLRTQAALRDARQPLPPAK